MRFILLVIFVAGSVSPIASACGFPRRAGNGAWSSDAFYAAQSRPSTDRELAVIAQVMAGNVPDRIRTFIPLRLPARIDGENVTLELDVMPDYLMIGTDADFVRAPLTNAAAQFIAGELGFVLPTPFLVDKIYDAADVQLVPQPTDWYKHDIEMRLGPNYVLFNQTIESQRAGRDGLIAGHKKDVVLSNILDAKPSKVVIYGWQRPGNRPIQPVAAPHDFTYEDYSHGIRYLGPELRLIAAGGRISSMPLPAALTDPVLGSILNGGAGPIHDVRAARSCTPQFRSATGLSAANCPPQPRLCP